MKRNEFFKHISDDKMPDIEQVRLNCINQKAAERKNQRKLRLKSVLIISAVLMGVFTISVFADIISPSWHIGEILENLTFKGFNANKIEEFDESKFKFSNGDTASASDIIYTCHYEITDPKAKEAQKFVWTDFDVIPPKVYFDTIEEAGKELAFAPKGLNYIPKGCSLWEVSTNKDENDNYSNNCYIKYISHTAKIDEFRAADISLSATYVGENATINISTKQNIEQITLGSGIEALVMIDEYGSGDHKTYSYNVMWIKDGVGYSLSGSPRFDKDELIKMAESVG